MKNLFRIGQSGVAHHLLLALLIVLPITGFGAYRVIYSKADSNPYTVRKPNGCWPGERDNNGCKLIPDINTRMADCAEYRIAPQGDRCVSQCANGSCFVNCIAGWHVSAQYGNCQQNTGDNAGGGGTGGGGGGSGGGGGTGNPNDKTEADCDRLHRNFNPSTKQCTDCKGGYQNQPGQDRGACIPKPSGGGTSTGSGGGSGGGGSTATAAGSSATGTSAFSATSIQNVQSRCTAKHLVYNEKDNSCGTRCIDGFVKIFSGACVENVTSVSCQGIIAVDGTCVGKNKVEEYCNALHLDYNKNRNICGNDCVDKFTKVSGLCVRQGTNPTTDPPVLSLDSSIDKQLCEVLGRQWEPGTRDAQGNVVKGCSTNACDKKDATIVANANDGAPYCSGYISKVSQTTCKQLHRNWVPKVNGCMQNAKKKDAGSRLAKAPECDTQYSTYVFKDGEDECLDPSVADNLANIAAATGKPFSALLGMTRAQLCNLNPGKHWNGSKCVDDKLATTNGGSSASGSTGGGSGAVGSDGSDGSSSSEYSDDQQAQATGTSSSSPSSHPSGQAGSSPSNAVSASCSALEQINSAKYACATQGVTGTFGSNTQCPSGFSGPTSQVAYHTAFSKWFKATVCYKPAAR